MLTKLRNRVENTEQGFTLIELLVVILIIGILAAIAIPSFLNQREKGQDACAKSMARTMQTAMETFFTENNTYAGATSASLNTIENQIPSGTGACGSTEAVTVGDTSASGAACAGSPDGDSYCVSAGSSAGPAANKRTFAIERTATGAITRECEAGGGCPTGGTW